MSNNTNMIIGPLLVSDLNAVSPDIIYGYPSPTAVAGVGYKIILNLAKSLSVEGLTHEGTAVIVHEHSVLGGHPKNPVTGTKVSSGAPVIDDFRARAEITLIVSVGNLMINDEDVIDAVFKQLPSLFFSGGKVFPKFFSAKKQVKLASENNLIDVLKWHKKGFVLFDRHDLLEEELASADGEIDTLDALLNCIQFSSDIEDDNESDRKKTSDKKDGGRRKYPGWLVPVFVGYQGIETRKKRSGARTLDGLNDHLFAESLYSLGEYKSLSSILASEGSLSLEGSFWKHSNNNTSETFFVTANA